MHRLTTKCDCKNKIKSHNHPRLHMLHVKSGSFKHFFFSAAVGIVCWECRCFLGGVREERPLLKLTWQIIRTDASAHMPAHLQLPPPFVPVGAVRSISPPDSVLFTLSPHSPLLHHLSALLYFQPHKSHHSCLPPLPSAPLGLLKVTKVFCKAFLFMMYYLKVQCCR